MVNNYLPVAAEAKAGMSDRNKIDFIAESMRWSYLVNECKYFKDDQKNERIRMQRSERMAFSKVEKVVTLYT